MRRRIVEIHAGHMVVPADLIRQTLRDLTADVRDHDIRRSIRQEFILHDRKALPGFRGIRKERGQIIVYTDLADGKAAVHTDQYKYGDDRKACIHNAGRDRFHHIRFLRFGFLLSDGSHGDHSHSSSMG